MSRQDVEVVRKLHDAWLAGDNEAALSLFDPDAVIDMRARPEGRIYRGPEGMYEAMRDWIESWDEYRFEPEDLLDAGAGSVVLLWREYGRGKGSGAGVEIRGATVWEVERGRVVGVRPYTDRRQALEAAGLSD
jgi:ketosteroid isomerase-like protein